MLPKFTFSFPLLLITIALFISSCDQIFLDSNDEPQLPPITMTGENTFGCLVNGEVFIPKGRRPGATVGNSANPKTKLEEADGTLLILASNSDFEFSFSLYGEKPVFSAEEMTLVTYSAYQAFSSIDDFDTPSGILYGQSKHHKDNA